MLRKQQERSAQGKRSAFRVGGMEVGMHKILRAARRSRNTATSASSPEPGESQCLVPRRDCCYSCYCILAIFTGPI